MEKKYYFGCYVWIFVELVCVWKCTFVFCTAGTKKCTWLSFRAYCAYLPTCNTSTHRRGNSVYHTYSTYREGSHQFFHTRKRSVRVAARMLNHKQTQYNKRETVHHKQTQYNKRDSISQADTAQYKRHSTIQERQNITSRLSTIKERQFIASGHSTIKETQYNTRDIVQYKDKRAKSVTKRSSGNQKHWIEKCF
jgi:hypothetical protein